jgi:2-oxoglutarate dehydrogenase E1 component
MIISAQEREVVFDSFRRWGFLQADLDPLGHLKPAPMPELDIEGEDAVRARKYYCGKIGVEFMHIPDGERRQWIADRMEADPPRANSQRILELLIRAWLFEEVLQKRYPGTKRFSLDGVTALLPALDAILSRGVDLGAEQAVVAMSHRGRLNVMVHVVGKVASDIFARFEDNDPRRVLGGGDVKYHLGATGDYTTESGRNLHIHLVSNPSHLEAVDPVAMGRARAKQDRVGATGREKVLPVIMHGDAAFAGQGVAAETFNMAMVDGYNVGGMVHIIVNNLIGFTGNPEDLYSSRFASAMANRLPVPIFHVNGEDPDAVVRVARLAAEYRYRFMTPVVMDIIGFRRHGHSEVDDPTVTQPIRYKKIARTPPLWQSYAGKLGAETAGLVDSFKEGYERDIRQARSSRRNPKLHSLPSYWDPYCGGLYNPAHEVDTAVSEVELQEVGEGVTQYPLGFTLHPRAKKLLDQRAEMMQGKAALDYGMAEALAFGSLLRKGIPVRLTGQDSRRGTFNHRHSVLFDMDTEATYTPLCHLSPDQARFDVFDSTLSEAGVLGFEYGYSRDCPEALVLWEAQFGDFANGAQVIIDQFIAAGEDKWGLLSGVVLLLPHGYEGQGPEHSSARVERYLQLAARDNIQICQPSTAAQYFHLLRRQALRKWRKPLVVFTPKGMLRHPAACSPLGEFSGGGFRTVIPDREVARPRKILLATGRILHELRAERKRMQDTETAILAVEQLYPFPEEELARELSIHAKAREYVWVQEEPANMGALSYILPRLRSLAGKRPVLSVRRSESSSPATGSAKAHALEQKTLLSLAFATGKESAGQP